MAPHPQADLHSRLPVAWLNHLGISTVHNTTSHSPTSPSFPKHPIETRGNAGTARHNQHSPFSASTHSDAQQWHHSTSKPAIPAVDARFHKHPFETHLRGITAHTNQPFPVLTLDSTSAHSRRASVASQRVTARRSSSGARFHEHPVETHVGGITFRNRCCCSCRMLRLHPQFSHPCQCRWMLAPSALERFVLLQLAELLLDVVGVLPQVASSQLACHLGTPCRSLANLRTIGAPKGGISARAACPKRQPSAMQDISSRLRPGISFLQAPTDRGDATRNHRPKILSPRPDVPARGPGSSGLHARVGPVQTLEFLPKIRCFRACSSRKGCCPR